jgi:hypothetical protein
MRKQTWSARTCLDGPERRLVEPPEQRLHPLVPPELLAGPERRRLVRRRGAGPDTAEEEEEQEKTRNKDGGAGRSTHLPVRWDPGLPRPPGEWMVHWLPLLAAALGGSRRRRIHWPRAEAERRLLGSLVLLPLRAQLALKRTLCSLRSSSSSSSRVRVVAFLPKEATSTRPTSTQRSLLPRTPRA